MADQSPELRQPSIDRPLRPASAEQPTTDALTTHLKREALLKREPWRTHLTNLESLMEDLNKSPKDTLEGQKSLFSDLAKAGRIGPQEAIVLAHTLFGGSDTDKLFLGHLLSEKHGPERIRLHNWRVASRMPENWLAANRAKIDSLTQPLYPPTAAFSYLNTLVLSGEPTTSFVPTASRRGWDSVLEDRSKVGRHEMKAKAMRTGKTMSRSCGGHQTVYSPLVHVLVERRVNIPLNAASVERPATHAFALAPQSAPTRQKILHRPTQPPR